MKIDWKKLAIVGLRFAANYILTRKAKRESESKVISLSYERGELLEGIVYIETDNIELFGALSKILKRRHRNIAKCYFNSSLASEDSAVFNVRVSIGSLQVMNRTFITPTKEFVFDVQEFIKTVL